MIDHKNIKDMLVDLDKELALEGETRDIIIFGSGALIVQGISNESRATVDIDMVKPEIDMKLQLICAKVGEKYGLDMSWLNSAGAIFSRNFPTGWESRSINVYSGGSLKVSSLCRKDLIATKFYAACTRANQLDFEDLNDLKPTAAELDYSKRWIKTQKDYEEIKSFLEANFKKYSKLAIEGYGK